MFRRRLQKGVLGIALLALFLADLLVQNGWAAPNLTLKWSRNLGSNSRTFVSPLAADLVGDSDLEIVIVGGSSDGGWDGMVTVLNGDDGRTVWQVSPQARGWGFGIGMHTCFEIADLYNDGKQKIIVAAEGGTFVLNGNDGSLNWSNPAAPGRENYLSVADVNGDGYKEVFVNRGNAPYSTVGYDWITMLSYDGKILRQGYSWHPCWGGLAVGDTNNDGKFELYQGDRQNTYANDEDTFKRGGQGLRALDASTLTPLWTVQNVLMSSHAPMLADVDKDGIQDVVVAMQSNGIGVFNSSDGSVLTTGGKYRASSSIRRVSVPSQPGMTANVSAHSQPTVADLDNDGNLEFVVAYDSPVVVWDLFNWSPDAVLLNETGGPVEVFEPPKAGDVNGDGLLDLIAVTVAGDIYVYSNGYSLVEHVDLPFGGGSDMTLVQDVDGDGRNELVVTGYNNGDVAAYDTPASTPNPKPRTGNTFYSEARRGAAVYVPAPIPDQPALSMEWPVNSATNQVLNPTLSVQVADFQKNLMNINFQTNVTGAWTTIQSYNQVGNNVYTAATSNMNQYGRKYYWRVTASDGYGHSTTETYQFTTLSTPPSQGTPSLVYSGTSLVAINVSTSDVNGDVVNNVYNWYVNSAPYANLNLPFDSRGSSNPMVTETIFEDDFETGFASWSSGGWTRVSSQQYSGDWSAQADGSSTTLTSVNIDTSATEGLTVSFWYRDVGIDDGDDVYLQFWNGSNYHNIFELGNTSPEGTWHFYSAQTFSAQFCRPDFRIRFYANSMTSNEYLWIDDISITVPSRTKDYSGYNTHATVHGAQWTPNGVVGGAYIFDGTTDYLRIPDISSLDGGGAWTGLSVEFWVKPLVAANGTRIVAKKVAGDSTGEYMVGFQTSGSPSCTLFFGVYNGTGWQDTWDNANTKLTPGNWYHVVCTYESGPGLKIYINGTLRNSKAVTGSISDPDASESVFGAPLFIGQDGSGDASRRFLNGILDEVKIYPRALSPEQISQNWLEAGNGQSSHATIVAQETATGQTWKCEVTPNDSFGDGTSKFSNSLITSPVQRRLTVSSAHDSPNPSVGDHFYGDGSSVTCSVTSPVTEDSTVWTCTGWSGTGSVPGSGTGSSVTFTITADSTITWNWQSGTAQRKLTVSSAHDSPNPSVGDHFYSGGSSVTCSVSSPVVESGVSYSCTGWSGTGSVPSSGSGTSVTFTITMDSAITWNWIVTPSVPAIFSDGFESGNFGTWTSTSGSPTVQSATARTGTYSMRTTGSVTQIATKTFGTVYAVYGRCYVRFDSLPASGGYLDFLELTGGGGCDQLVGVYNDGGTVKWCLRRSPWGARPEKLASSGPTTGVWYCVELFVSTSASSPYTTSETVWVNDVSLITDTYTAAAGAGIGSIKVGADDKTTSLTNYVDDVVVSTTRIGQLPVGPQRKLAVASAHDSPSPEIGDHFYGDGSSVTCSVTSPVTEDSTVWTCTGWSGTGSVPGSGTGSSVTFSITADSTITWNWQSGAVQWRLTVSSAHGSPNPSVGDHFYSGGSSVTCSVTSPVTEGGVSYSCTGWSGTGSVPSSGSGTSVTFTISQDSAITWNWIVTPSVPAIFSDGFESGNFGAWTSTTGSPTVQSTTARTGTYAMRATGSATQKVLKTFGTVYTVYGRCYVRFDSLPASGGYLDFLELTGGGGCDQLVGIYNDGGTVKWCLRRSPWGARPEKLASSGPTTGVWYCVELFVSTSASSPYATSETVWVDGVQIVTDTYNAAAGAGIGSIKVGADDKTTTLTNYIDDVVVSTAYIGL